MDMVRMALFIACANVAPLVLVVLYPTNLPRLFCLVPVLKCGRLSWNGVSLLKCVALWRSPSGVHVSVQLIF
jgi:hypothetical protein